MPETLKKLREPAALAAVLFAGLVLLVGVINLLAPPSSGGVSEPFANRAADQVGRFLSLDVAIAVAVGVYLANHVAPALPKARLITLIALVESGVAVVFGVITGLAQFGAGGLGGEGKFLGFLAAVGGAAVVGVAALYVWTTWQTHAAQSPRPAGGQRFQPGGGNWQGGGGAGGAGEQQYPQQSPPPGGFGWTPQQGQQQPPQAGQQGQSGPTAFGQQQVPGAGAAQQPFGVDRTQLLPPVQAGGQPPQPPQHQAQPQSQPQPGGYFGEQQAGAAPQPPLPPTMQDYAAQQSPWSPGVTGGAFSAPQPPQPPQPTQPPQPAQQIPPARNQEQDQQRGPFQVGDWGSD
ncbi:MAG: hypothetical protein ACRDVE_22240 [Actinocrinis sp.]